MTLSEYLIQLYPKERDLYKYRIDGWPIYRSVRRLLIERACDAEGKEMMRWNAGIDYLSSIKNGICSAWSLLLFLLSNRKADTVIISFMRVDKVGANYMDKFTDPLIELCGKELGSFIILDQGMAGVHKRPRLHQEYCLQTDIFVIIERIFGRLHRRVFYKKYGDTIDALCLDIESIYGKQVCITKQSLSQIVCSALKYQRIYKWLFEKLEAKRIIFPTRRIIEIFVAHQLGMKAFECQHGITYGETPHYGGYFPEELVPDGFLAFGNNDPIDVYGIDSSKITNIGWAFGEYVSRIHDFKQYGQNDVLVISDPEITDGIISATLTLASNNKQCHFYVRPHPHEIISDEQRKRLEGAHNCHWQDRQINIAVVMQGFRNVVGESSTVLYEALSVGKKVGKLFFYGLTPQYLNDEDRECFWEIKDETTFREFLNDDKSARKSKSIYSTFDKDLFLKTIVVN